MSGRVVKEVANGARKVSIILAEEVQDKGYQRVIDAIDPTVIAQTDSRKGCKCIQRIGNDDGGPKSSSRQDNNHVRHSSSEDLNESC